MADGHNTPLPLGATDVFELRPRIGFASTALARRIPGNERTLDVVMTASYSVTGRWNENYDEVDVRRAQRVLREWHLDGFEDRLFGTLSDGERKRTQIARAVMPDPELLLLDEPVASLDPATAQSVLTLLHDICKKDRLTAIVSLHQVNLARMFADRIVGLRQGQVVFDGTAAQLTEEAQSALYAKSSPANMGSQFDSPSQSKEFLPC